MALPVWKAAEIKIIPCTCISIQTSMHTQLYTFWHTKTRQTRHCNIRLIWSFFWHSPTFAVFRRAYMACTCMLDVYHKWYPSRSEHVGTHRWRALACGGRKNKSLHDDNQLQVFAPTIAFHSVALLPSWSQHDPDAIIGQ